MFALDAAYSVPVAAVGAFATIVVAWITYLGVRRAAPTTAVAQALEPRLSDTEQMVAGWRRALDAKDEIIAAKDEEIARLNGLLANRPARRRNPAGE